MAAGRVHWYGLAVDAQRLGRGKAQGLDRAANLGRGVLARLARFGDDGLGELVASFFEQARGLGENRGPRVGRQPAHVGSAGLSGRDGGINDRLGCDRHLGDDRFVVRVQDRQGLLSRDPFAGDQQL